MITIEEHRSRERLRELQSLNLDQKIDHALGTLEAFLNAAPDPAISFSGGKDSTVLLHLIRNVLRKDIPAVFVNTGNEYPEIIKFVRSFKNVTILRPRYNLKQIIAKYGFPLISKSYAKMIYELKKGTKCNHVYLMERLPDGTRNKWFLPERFRYLAREEFSCSDKCCNFLKKQPMQKINSITGEMAGESALRKSAWVHSGCNNFAGKHAISKPLSIWTSNDVREYARAYNVRLCPIYDDPRVDRTGCMFCGFGAHLEKYSRFERLKETYPKLYRYFLSLENNGVTYERALNRAGIILPHQPGYQTTIYSKSVQS
jgi:3'-phosphoadenosine 5'-phosphosulfate sulfotransferase (PAPS reductase)/FAD synthetase